MADRSKHDARSATNSNSKKIFQAMTLYRVRVNAQIRTTYRIIADNEDEARRKASLMLSNSAKGDILDAEFKIEIEKQSDESGAG